MSVWKGTGRRRLTIKIRDELVGCLIDADGKNDSFQAMDGVDLQVDFLSLHLLFQEGEGIHVFDHYCISWVVFGWILQSESHSN